jgi:hypothetical protein
MKRGGRTLYRVAEKWGAMRSYTAWTVRCSRAEGVSSGGNWEGVTATGMAVVGGGWWVVGDG